LKVERRRSKSPRSQGRQEGTEERCSTEPTTSRESALDLWRRRASPLAGNAGDEAPAELRGRKEGILGKIERKRQNPRKWRVVNEVMVKNNYANKRRR